MSDVTGKPFGDIYAYIDRQIAAAVLAAATDHQTLSHRLRPHDGHDLYPRVDGARGMDSGANLEQGRAPVTDLETATRAWVLNQVSGADVIKPPLGHDITQLPSVVSHWPILDTVLGGTSVPDVNGAHNSTSATTIVASGRPWHGSEGQVWLARKATLAGSAALLTELRDASCYFMFWAMVGKADSASSSCVFFTFTAAAETSATNTQLQVQISQSYDLIVFWERSSGSNISATIGKVAPGLRHICVARQHGATSTVHAWIDGLYCGATSSLLNPDGGGSSSGFFMVDNTGTMGDTQTGCALGDCVLGSGGIPTTAQVLAQYQRGMGVY